jgi:hypothetical protein
VLIAEYAVLPQLVGARAALDLLAHVSPTTLLVALILESASLLCYTALTRSVPQVAWALSRESWCLR